MDVHIDGSQGEGGGQMLRSAVALSLLARKSFRMENIRARRKDPGLKAQHLTVLRAARMLADCGHSEVRVGARSVDFWPGRVRGGEFEIDVGTAGSIALILQALLPACVFAEGPSRLTLIGGTDVSNSMTLEYLRNVPIFAAMKCAERLTLDVKVRGFYPKGGGMVQSEIVPRWSGEWSKVAPMARAEHGRIGRTDRASVLQIRLIAVASESLRARRVAERLIDGAKEALRKVAVRAASTVEYSPSRSPGCSLTAVADLHGGATLGADGLGAPGKPAEAVGREVAERLLGEIESGAPVDVHAADNLILWLALFGGAFRASAISEHTRTNIRLVEQFLGPTFRIDLPDVVRIIGPTSG